ncbi:cytochrome P450 2F2-like isoform X2 [Clupea harengus]|uniref:Cytochrome P450 2F2-like isoform X2 n=1 Tax=Clupea harengus TaxID=7950 RepID=A0A8M1KBM3_CLUHA|nr:cytochrome P450 2F2-like isoform X2 [Clupea harengus]
MQHMFVELLVSACVHRHIHIHSHTHTNTHTHAKTQPRTVTYTHTRAKTPTHSVTMLSSLLLLWLGVLLLFLLFRVRRPKNFPPGPTALPLLGNLLELSPHNPLQSFDRLAERYGPVYSLYFGPRPAVVLASQQVIKEALVTRATEFAGRPDHMLVCHVTQCKGVVLADYGPKWQEHRRFALTTLRNFGMGKRTMEEKILEETRHICAELEKHAGRSMDPEHLFHYAASDIICSVIFGSRFEYDDPYFKDLIVMIQGLTKLVFDPWAIRAFHLHDHVKGRILKVVAEHKDSRVSGQPRDLIDCYLDEMEKRADKGTSFEDSQLVAVCFDLLIAGTDTTSNTLRTATLYLITHPHIQERCYQEIDEVLGSREQVLFEDRQAMPYVQAVIHEAQRVADTVPLSMIHTTTADTHTQGYSIPKGTMIIPYLSSALREEGQWKSPHDFNPENFLNERGEFVKPDAFMPFSTGSRMCLGEGLARMELFLILVTLLRRFRLVWPEERGVPDYSMVFGGTQAAKPFQVTVHLRGA